MPVCNGCGGFVTARFARVFGDNDGDVYGCRDCLAVSDLTEGRAAQDEL